MDEPDIGKKIEALYVPYIGVFNVTDLGSLKCFTYGTTYGKIWDLLMGLHMECLRFCC